MYITLLKLTQLRLLGISIIKIDFGTNVRHSKFKHYANFMADYNL